MTRSLDADLTIAYVRELAALFRRDETYYRGLRLGRQNWQRAECAKGKVAVLEELAKQLDQQAVSLKATA